MEFMTLIKQILTVLAATTALSALGVYHYQQSKIGLLAPLIGDWNVELKIKEPRELAGIFQGTARFSWDPNKEHIRAEGSLTNGKDTKYATGFLTFDDDGPEIEHGYRGAFTNADDGRILQLKGKFNGNVIVFHGSPLASDNNKDLKVRVTVEPGKDKLLVLVDIVFEATAARMLEMSFSRKTTETQKNQ